MILKHSVLNFQNKDTEFLEKMLSLHQMSDEKFAMELFVPNLSD